MRIGFFTDRYFPLVDGVSVSIETFRIELEKLGHQVYIFCPSGAKKNLYEPERIIRFRSYRSFLRRLPHQARLVDATRNSSPGVGLAHGLSDPVVSRVLDQNLE